MARAALRGMVVEVACAEAERQTLIALEVPVGTTIAQAIELSGIAGAHPGINIKEMKTGIFGKLAPREAVLREGDRVEIYRPLSIDPKEARKRRGGRKR